MHKSELENQLTPAFRYFTSFALIFMEKKLVVPPKVGGRVGRQSWEVVREGGMLQSNICFSELKVAIFQKYMHDGASTYRVMLELSFPFYKRKHKTKNW